MLNLIKIVGLKKPLGGGVQGGIHCKTGLTDTLLNMERNQDLPQSTVNSTQYSDGAFGKRT